MTLGGIDLVRERVIDGLRGREWHAAAAAALAGRSPTAATSTAVDLNP